MRFLADENVSRFVVERLRAAGFEVTALGMTSQTARVLGLTSDVSRDCDVEGAVRPYCAYVSVVIQHPYEDIDGAIA